MRTLPRSLSLVVGLGLAACAQEPVFIAPDVTVASGAQASSGDGVGGGGDGGSGPTSGPSTTGGEGGAGATTASGDGGAGGGELPAGNFTLSVDGDPPVLELRDAATITVTIEADGDVGTVSLGVEGLPEDVVATIDEETPTIVDGTQTFSIEIASASDAPTGDFDFTVRAVAAGGDVTASGAFTIEPVLTVMIPMNLAGFGDNPPDTTAFGDYPTRIRALPDMSDANPITIHFFNQDVVTHEIHAGNPDQGFGHGQGPIPANDFDPVVRRVNAPGTYDYYPHDIGQSILGRIIIE